jgi:hypothetical protein
MLCILLFAGFSYLISCVIGNNRKNMKNLLAATRDILFRYFILIFAVSTIKALLGEPEHTLLQSFWDIEIQTCFHYNSSDCCRRLGGYYEDVW